MRKLRIINLAVVFTALVLEALPVGAVLNFAVAPESGGGTERMTYSYFDLMPFGYANFGPFITAITTVALTVITVIACVSRKGAALCRFAGGLSLAGLAASLAPLMFGLSFYSVVGLFISLMLAASAVLGFAGAVKNE